MLNISHYENFKGGPTLLFSGYASDIRLLLDCFNSWDGEDFDLIERLKHTQTLNGTVKQLLIIRANNMNDSFLTWRNKQGIWSVSMHGQKQIIELLQNLINSEGSGHQYLDMSPSEIQIMCSQEEYKKS
jgi:hypothetical protein